MREDVIPSPIWHVVLDLDLPHVSGIDVQQEIVSHAETRAIPIIIGTGTRWRAPAGVFRTLRKPITSDVLETVTIVLSDVRP